jgi:hypothetical protein
MQQGLHETNKVTRVDFCGDFKMFLEDTLAVPQSIRFKDQDHIHLNSCEYKQNMHV